MKIRIRWKWKEIMEKSARIDLARHLSSAPPFVVRDSGSLNLLVNAVLKAEYVFVPTSLSYAFTAFRKKDSLNELSVNEKVIISGKLNVKTKRVQKYIIAPSILRILNRTLVNSSDKYLYVN